ncbi:hypothetical protein JMN32_05090 [Fulvivirga sp. 29W222]|uniref:Uncharacterized protein n=1 Tax=Fulvivirga marina TaxID=2494733 RepID=A0A937FVF7_9BACT|nr:hypothetical protein [Fulvivirga marina]MBL6445672.1 hypothetical protein [Fulvivirga marina]
METTHILSHWRYYLALESDLEKISRYIEFHPSNNKTYSIELAHLFLTSCSEIDVLFKLICTKFDPSSKASNINNYQDELLNHHFEIVHEYVYLDRFNYGFQPFNQWHEFKVLDWWSAHNKVKHTRDQHFPKANLINTLMAMGALLILNIYFYTINTNSELTIVSIKETMRKLRPMSHFLSLKSQYYPVSIIA